MEVLVERNIKDIEKEKAPVKEPPKGVPAPEQVEIDLHLEALITDRNVNMTAGEKLQFQIQHFRHAMQEAMRTPHIKRLVAIHGVGNGTLAKEVQRILRLEFPQCRYQDASFKEYGYGDTERAGNKNRKIKYKSRSVSNASRKRSVKDGVEVWYCRTAQRREVYVI